MGPDRIPFFKSGSWCYKVCEPLVEVYTKRSVMVSAERILATIDGRLLRIQILFLGMISRETNCNYRVRGGRTDNSWLLIVALERAQKITEPRKIFKYFQLLCSKYQWHTCGPAEKYATAHQLTMAGLWGELDKQSTCRAIFENREHYNLVCFVGNNLCKRYLFPPLCIGSFIYKVWHN